MTGSKYTEVVSLHAVAGGVISVLNGSKFGYGFVSAGFTKSLGHSIAQLGDNQELQSLVTVIVGGTASRLSGGKFANGATTAAFQVALNFFGGGRSSDKEERPDLGVVGNWLRSRLDTSIEKENFERYWLGKGDVTLSKEQFDQIMSTLKTDMITHEQGVFNFSNKSGNFYAYKYDFYDTKFDGLLGRAWVIFNRKGVPVGLYDRYDFNLKSWSERTLGNHIKTIGVLTATQYFGDTAKSFEIKFGVTSGALP